MSDEKKWVKHRLVYLGAIITQGEKTSAGFAKADDKTLARAGAWDLLKGKGRRSFIPGAIYEVEGDEACETIKPGTFDYQGMHPDKSVVEQAYAKDRAVRALAEARKRESDEAKKNRIREAAAPLRAMMAKAVGYERDFLLAVIVREITGRVI